MAGVKREREEETLSHIASALLGEEQNRELEQMYFAGIGFSKKRDTGSETRSGDKKLPKRKVCLLMSYSGKDYFGMQIIPDKPSIELDLHKALYLSGAISRDNAMNPVKSGFTRCARTDKGVHAGGQVCALKMIIEDDKIVEKINQYLPPQIRVWGYVRVQNSFNAQKQCDSRIYEYLLPTYMLKECDPLLYPFSQVGIDNNATLNRELFSIVEFPDLQEDEIKDMTKYRISQEALQKFRSLLDRYKGTHNFCNFTIGKTFDEQSNKRYIMSFTCSDPFEIQGQEWVSCKVKGQSFMLHQIRKMMGLVIMMMRTKTPETLFDNCFGETKMNIPKAPALGLLLERPLFDSYNTRMPEAPVDFTPYQDQIEEFKKKYIYEHIYEVDQRDAEFLKWLRTVDRTPDEIGWWLQPDGTLNLDKKPVFTHEKPKQE
ncbi:pseudouridine synthase [Gorgonomyces haynaldii]|nr:pseudouridine synthase [Gorgonomyces haynaldii]